MENASLVAVSRQIALGAQMETVANNLANMNTPAFKSQSLLFAAMLEGQEGFIDDPLGPVAFNQTLGTYVDFSAGSLASTGNPLDVGISGEGFFSVETPDGVRYSRNGRFALGPGGELIDSSGNKVLGNGGGPLVIPEATDISIATDGTISANGAVVGRLGIVSFDETHRLERTGDGLYDAGDMAATPMEAPEVAQGMIEQSNVSAVHEMTRMVEVSKEYQRITRLIEQESERQRLALQRLSRAG